VEVLFKGIWDDRLSREVEELRALLSRQGVNEG